MAARLDNVFAADPCGSRAMQSKSPTYRPGLRGGALVVMVCALALAPVVWSEPLRRTYVQTVQRYVARVAPPRMVLVGDSLVAQSSWGMGGINLAQGGLTIAQASPQASAAMAYRPGYLVVEAGINDVLQGRTSEQIEADYDLLLSYARGRTKVVVTLIPYTSWPAHRQAITAANVVIERAARRHGAAVIDLNPLISKDGVRRAEYATDGVHLNRAAYRLWREALERQFAGR
jgi:lysophospholipase L1-like esterase